MKLSEFETVLMQFFWEQDNVSAPQMHQLISKSKDVTYSTVKTIIDRLEKKKAIVRSDQQGRTIFYKAAITADQLQKPMLQNFIDKVFGGDKQRLINHLFDENNLSQEDIEYLTSMIEKAKQND